jgi:acetyl-CoA acetyltransferase
MPGSVIVGGARTPIGKLAGSLKDFSAMDLGGFAIKSALERTGITGDQVDYVIVHNPVRARGDLFRNSGLERKLKEFGAQEVTLPGITPTT